MPDERRRRRGVGLPAGSAVGAARRARRAPGALDACSGITPRRAAARVAWAEGSAQRVPRRDRGRSRRAPTATARSSHGRSRRGRGGARGLRRRGSSRTGDPELSARARATSHRPAGRALPARAAVRAGTEQRVAIVGSRQLLAARTRGRRTTSAAGSRAAGVHVVSGAAHGHRRGRPPGRARRAGGRTVAVLGVRHRRRLSAGERARCSIGSSRRGTVVSEYPPGVAGRAAPVPGAEPDRRRRCRGRWSWSRAPSGAGRGSRPTTRSTSGSTSSPCPVP